MNSLNIVHFNPDGIRGRQTNILNYIDQENTHVIAVSETHLKPNQHFSLGNFIPIRKDRTERRKGGVAFFINNKIEFTGSKKLKESKYYLTDDLHPETRKIHNKLVPIMKEMRKKGYLAFIPWTVPRLIKYKDSPKGTPGPIKVYRLGEGTVDG